MSRRQKNPLRQLLTEEHRWLSIISRATSEPASHVVRAQQLLAVAAGASYSEAARASGRKSNDAVAHLVARFNREGLKAVEPKRGSGAPPTYGTVERARILHEARRPPNPETDGTANWSLMTLQRALRQASHGLPHVSTYTIRTVLKEAGFGWLQTRTWCETGSSIRRRKSGKPVEVIDVDAEAKKADSTSL
jgi:transposase